MIHGNSIIGNDCIIRHGVILGINSLSRLTDAPQLGDNVDIGAGAKLLGKVRVGNQVRIGANAVVLTDVPEGATVFGVPARVVWKTEI
jgi:serine O-acetyltransferase